MPIPDFDEINQRARKQSLAERNLIMDQCEPQGSKADSNTGGTGGSAVGVGYSRPLTPTSLATLLLVYATPPSGRVLDTVDISHLVAEGLMVANEKGIAVTSKGEMYIHMVLSTPLPIHKWLDPRK